MNVAHVVAFVAVTMGCARSVAARDAGPISQSLTREAARLAHAPALAHQVDSGPADARWTKLRGHDGEKAVVSTRAHGEIRGRLRAPGANAIDVEQGGQVVRIARADVCDITNMESPVLRKARWGAIGTVAGLGAGYLFNVAQGLADIQYSQRTFTPGATYAIGAMSGFTIGWLAAGSQPVSTPNYLYADYDRRGCR